MDLLKTLLVYMMLVLGSATEAGPAATPPPALPTATPRVFVIATPYTHVTPAPTAVPTAVPTLAPTAVPTAYTTLYVGDRGEDVRKLQRRLAELGYLTDKIDGVFGQNTKRAAPPNGRCLKAATWSSLRRTSLSAPPHLPRR